MVQNYLTLLTSTIIFVIASINWLTSWGYRERKSAALIWYISVVFMLICLLYWHSGASSST